MQRRDFMLGAMGVALVSAGPAIAGARAIGGPAFGSSWRATIPATTDADRARRMIEGILKDVDRRFSPYRPDSALSRFNAAPPAEWQAVDPDFSLVAREALRTAEVTQGCFDPTVGPLVARQGFGPISGSAATFADIGIGEGRLRKATPGATLDLCGIAKGHALDLVCAALEAAGLDRAIVEVGGEVKALGNHPDGRDWVVAIADPLVPGAARRIVAPRGLALATSGHAVNGVRARVNASHIIDPHRRAAARQSLLSVSVFDRSAMRADALATALCAAGREEGEALARRLAIPALFILDDAEHATGGFETHILA